MRTCLRAVSGVSTQWLYPRWVLDPDRGRVVSQEKEMSVLDIVYVIAAIAVFAVIGLVARGVEKL